MKYTVPVETFDEPKASTKPEPYRPSVHVPTHKNAMQDCDVDDEVTIIIRGKVKGFNMNSYRANKNEAEIHVEMHTTELVKGKKTQIEQLDEELDKDD